MIEVIIIVGIMAIVIAIFAFNEDLLSKGFKWKAKDGDKDGIIQEGTRWERRAKKK
jgi:hypothetical protein